MLTLFESRYTLKGRYNIGNVGKTASMSMPTLFESRYTLYMKTTNMWNTLQSDLLFLMWSFVSNDSISEKISMED